MDMDMMMTGNSAVVPMAPGAVANKGNYSAAASAPAPSAPNTIKMSKIVACEIKVFPLL